MRRGDEIVALENDMIGLCNLIDGSGSTGCGKGTDGVCACAYKGATDASKGGWHGMKASGSGANPTQIETNNWTDHQGHLRNPRQRRNETKRRDISTVMIAALATLRTRLKPDKAATENPTNTYCLGQAGNQGCDAPSTAGRMRLLRKRNRGKNRRPARLAPTAVEIAARMREPPTWKERSVAQRREHAAPTQTSDGANTWKHSGKAAQRLRETAKEKTQRQPPKAAEQGTRKMKTTRQGPVRWRTKAARRTVNANVTERTRTGTKTQKRARTQQQRARHFWRQPDAWRS
ncbi:hypothetical protein ERJ75_001112800 [Trypanosoma vivax]|nr:hypothetical protein ERJ75_001112800 [Trypanosoma vivax]